MTDNPRQCSTPEGGTTTPAGQPRPPGGGCAKLPESAPPTLADPPPCPGPDCTCPTPPTADASCLEKLITEQAGQIAGAEKAKAFKADLEAFLGKARSAAQEYTREKYEKLLKLWVEQDGQIVELLRKLECAVCCWRCVLECHVCPLVNKMVLAERWLYGDGTQYETLHDLPDLQYWLQRDRDAKERRFLRIKSVLAAWEKPAQTLEKALADDAKLIADASKALGTDAPKVLFDVFLKLVPMHLAIAPPVGPGPTTGIDERFTHLCGCDTAEPDDCCGPDVGKTRWSIRQRLLGPQPYLIDPNDYLKLTCCLVSERYGPAKEQLAEAERALAEVEARIKGFRAQVEDGLKSFEKDARAAIPSIVDCSTYQPVETHGKTSQAR